jgi:hypothetical protein
LFEFILGVHEPNPGDFDLPAVGGVSGQRHDGKTTYEASKSTDCVAIELGKWRDPQKYPDKRGIAPGGSPGPRSEVS